MMCAAASTSAAGRRACAEHTEQRHHEDSVDVDVAEAARSQVPRHPPATPVEQRCRLGPEGRVLERGVDPDAQHRSLVRVRRVVAAEPSTQGRLCPPARRMRRTSGISVTVAADGLHRPRREDARELILVPEVPVEGTVRDARRGHEIVDPRVVVAAVDEHVASGREQRGRARDCRGSPRRSPPRPVGTSRASRCRSASAGGGEPSGGCTFTSARSPNSVRCRTSVIASSTRSLGIRVRRDRAEDPGDVECVVQALQEQSDDRIELPRRERRGHQPGVDPGDGLLPRAPGHGREELVGLVCVEDRFVACVDLRVAGDPCRAARPSRRGRRSARRAPRSTRSPGASPARRADGTPPPCSRSTGRRRRASIERAS